jgi:hypothetical protein
MEPGFEVEVEVEVEVEAEVLGGPPPGPEADGLAGQTGYYRIVRDDESDSNRRRGLVAGGLAYVVFGGDKIRVIIGGNAWLYDPDDPDFAATYRPEPGGAAERQAQIAALMGEVEQLGGEEARTQAQLAHFDPHAGDGARATGTALAPAVGGMKASKLAIATVRNRIARTTKELKQKTGQLQALLEEQTRAMQARAEVMAGLVKKAEEAIWTINLYLGKGEEIHVLRSGEPAPTAGPIVLRQLVKYMDEECAAWAESGGIDARSVGVFDAWLLEDAGHLDRVLPEPKGIVALHPRRRAKKYGDPFTDSVMNAANQTWTYFLARNGENVYRVLVDLNVGDHLFPHADEFAGLFDGLKPGTREYTKAIERANADNRHYLRVLLVLQGLLDRTAIFRPMPVERLNLCDPAAVEEWVRFRRDDEKVLTDGRPAFREWQAEVNARLEVGHRVVGHWDYDLRGGQYQAGRITPAGACLPDDAEVHTIERREGDDYVFLYERKRDTVYDEGARDWRRPRARAGCRLERDDRFFLDFDAATLADLRYYRDHRQSRVEYASMVPVLDVAIAAKEREEREEAPFRRLLAGQIMRAHGAEREDAEGKVDGLVSWWKFKNRAGRALTSDDRLALEQIVAEYGRRRKQDDIRERLDHAAALEAILAQEPAPVFVAHKADNRYVAYRPMNDRDVWVEEQEWAVARGQARLREARPWRLVDLRHRKWEVIHRDARWDGWRVNPQRSRVLTDPEVEGLVDRACDRLAREPGLAWARPGRFLPLFAHCDDQFQVTLWYSDRGPQVPPLLVSGGRIEGPGLARFRLGWSRAGDGGDPGLTLSDHGHYSNPPDPDRHGPETWVVRRWPDHLATFRTEDDEARLARRTETMLRKMYDHAADRCERAVHEARLAAARAEYLIEEHGDPELWDDHLRTLGLQKPHFALLRTALSWHAERHLDPVGRTAGEVIEAARPWGLFEPVRTRSYYAPEATPEIPADLPLDFVIPPRPAPEPGTTAVGDDDDDDEF